MLPNRHARALVAASALLALAPAVAAQSNVIPGTDVSLGILANFSYQGRQGAFPNGTNAFAMATTSCNVGSVNVPWLEPMNENHPFIAFLVVREDQSGRMVQISDRSHVKHGFFALSSSQCTPCQVPSPGTFLGVGCSDTYSVSNNANNFYLAPADEIDPWLGAWEATCSFFDAGLDPQPGTQCDGQRSFTFSQSLSLGPVGNRVRVRDEDLVPDGPTTFHYASQYVVRGEPEANRENNIGSRPFSPSWTGSSWQVPTVGDFVQGSVLQRWNGAILRSGRNDEDGRVYVAVKVTGPDAGGMYRYEYALHNRDNFRGVGTVRLPVCAGMDVQGFGFRDIDDDPSNDWTMTIEGGELVIGGDDNPLRWNTIYNFWFDAPSAPSSGVASLVAFDPGTGAPEFSVETLVPGSPYAVTTGPGCSSGTPPTLVANGAPTLGSGAFALLADGLDANAPFVLYGSGVSGSQPFGACVAQLGGVFGIDVLMLGIGTADATGHATLSLPLPNDPALDGLSFDFQLLALTLDDPPLLGLAELSDGLRVRFGTAGSGCP